VPAAIPGSACYPRWASAYLWPHRSGNPAAFAIEQLTCLAKQRSCIGHGWLNSQIIRPAKQQHTANTEELCRLNQPAPHQWAALWQCDNHQIGPTDQVIINTTRPRNRCMPNPLLAQIGFGHAQGNRIQITQKDLCSGKAARQHQRQSPMASAIDHHLRSVWDAGTRLGQQLVRRIKAIPSRKTWPGYHCHLLPIQIQVQCLLFGMHHPLIALPSNGTPKLHSPLLTTQREGG
jgi:hypothetical protein